MNDDVAERDDLSAAEGDLNLGIIVAGLIEVAIRHGVFTRSGDGIDDRHIAGELLNGCALLLRSKNERGSSEIDDHIVRVFQREIDVVESIVLKYIDVNHGVLFVRFVCVMSVVETVKDLSDNSST